MQRKDSVLVFVCLLGFGFVVVVFTCPEMVSCYQEAVPVLICFNTD